MNKPLAFKVRTVGHYTGVKGGDIKKGTGGCGAIWYEDKTFTVAATQDQWLCAYPANNNYIYKKPNMNPSTKPLRYLSVCSGMEAASVAWHHLGWQPVGFSEIEPFPSAILKHHYPTIPNYGDLTQYKQWPIERGSIDLLVSGTPCQAFSVAGLRKGLDDPRGNLALVFLGLADKLKPRWIVWENVPGVLSSNGGRDFGSFLGALGQLGYGWAYRVLDAQHFGVAQRRRRCFVVACLGDWQSPAKVLFESDCLRRDIKKGRKKGQSPATSVENSVGAGLPIWRAGDQANAEHMIDHAGTINCNKGSLGGFIAKQVTYDMKQHHNPQPSDNVQLTTKNCASVRGDTPLVQPNNVAQPIPIQDGRDIEKHQNGMGIAKEGDPAYTIDTTGSQAIAFRKSKRACSTTDNETWVEADASNTLNNFDLGDTRTTHAVVYENHPNDSRVTGPHDVAPTVVSRFGTGGGNVPFVSNENQSMAVRRLTPKECERLQGFPDNYSQIPWKGKPAEQCPDGPRYKACGNSMAVPVMSWIGERIQKHIDGKL